VHKLKAFILVEPYTLDTHLQFLVDELVGKNIDPVLIHDHTTLEERIRQQPQDQPILWYEHQNYHINSIEAVCSWLVSHIDTQFPGTTDKCERVLGFYPRGVNKINGKTIMLKPYPYRASIILKTFKEPFVENPRLILFTMDREPYFQLTINSLMHSLPPLLQNKPPLTIVLNQPTEGTRRIALNAAKKYGNQLDILEVTPNSKITAISIALIWHRPKVFICLDDDFILPNYTADVYYNWPRLFNEKLQFFDICGWGINIDNYPYTPIPIEYTKSQINTNTKLLNGYSWMYNEPFTLMGQGLAMSAELYTKASRRHDRAGIDSIILPQAIKGKCSPTTLGYHIGWNQYQDGFVKLNARKWDDFGWSGTYQVHNSITGETREICPRKEL